MSVKPISRRDFLKSSAAALSSLALAGCSGRSEPVAKEEGLLLHLGFDEGNGTQVLDQSENLAEAVVEYQYTHAVYMEPQEPQWRETGVQGGSLLFDGCSTCIRYTPELLSVSGKALSISVWVAPRAFEWDDPNAADNGTAKLTAIVGQYNREIHKGFLLGYQRYGRLCFEVGCGTDHYILWAEKGIGNLNRYEWNQVIAVFDGEAGQMSLTLNGNSVGVLTIPTGSEIIGAENEALLIGQNAHGDKIAAGMYQMFSGLMDDLKLYNRVLTEEETAYQPADEIPFEAISLENILTGDVYKTQFHGGPYQHWMNEPHAPLYYNGVYHLFFQQNPVGTYWRNICWGHLVSEDMVHWRPIREAIVPTEDSVVPDGVWSGGAAEDANGVPLLFFTAGNDSFSSSGLISNQNIGVAYPADLHDPELTEWVIYDQLAVRQQPGHGRTGEFRDASIWKEDGRWYMVVCSGSTESTGGSALLYITDRLEVKPDGTIDMDWQYQGPVYEMEHPSIVYGTSWELPILLPLTNTAGTTKYFFCISPAPAGLADNKAYYFIGEFNKSTGKFTPDPAFEGAPRLLDYGDNVFTGPSAFVDPVSGETILFSIMQDQRNGAEEGAAGWAHCVGLPRRIFLNEAGTDVQISPFKALHNLESKVLAQGEMLSIDEANRLLETVAGDLLYLKVIFAAEDTADFGIKVKVGGKWDETEYRYTPASNTISGITQTRGSQATPGRVSGPLELTDRTLKAEIFIDRSLVEGFFNDTKAISIRSYSEFDAQGIQLFSEGSVCVQELYVAQMESIF